MMPVNSASRASTKNRPKLGNMLLVEIPELPIGA
jgi:hypothetical protein